MFKPMLAGTPEAPISSNRFPLFVSPKLDGIRATIQGGVAYSRSLKPSPNKWVQQLLGHPELEGLDGELIIGDPAAPDCFQKSSGPLARIEGKPNFVFHVFDCFDPTKPFAERLALAEAKVKAFNKPYVQIVPHSLVKDADLLQKIEAVAVECGYEGIMIRSQRGPYKQGRSTENEGYLLKIKRFVDGEGVVLELIEGATNTNPSFTNELGKTTRSTAKSGKVKNGTLGAYLVKNLETGVEHKVSPNGTDAYCDNIWENREHYVGKILKFRYFPTGSKDKPRFSQAVGFRDASDFETPA